MSSLALMRWLEATPERYDAGMRAITLGRVTALHGAVAAAAAPKAGGEIVEIGCGTGAVTKRLVERGAHVTALDQSAEMMEQARRGGVEMVLEDVPDHADRLLRAVGVVGSSGTGSPPPP